MHASALGGALIFLGCQGRFFPQTTPTSWADPASLAVPVLLPVLLSYAFVTLSLEVDFSGRNRVGQVLVLLAGAATAAAAEVLLRVGVPAACEHLLHLAPPAETEATKHLRAAASAVLALVVIVGARHVKGFSTRAAIASIAVAGAVYVLSTEVGAAATAMIEKQLADQEL
jgi:hypothetical protein